jgi:hypothetical protein
MGVKKIMKELKLAIWGKQKMNAEDVLVEFFVKIRKTCDEELERLKPIDTKAIKEYDPEKIAWMRTGGQKGPYERYPAFQQKPTPTADYVNLLNDLKKHDGKLVRNNLFYWLWEDEATIGRKPKVK